MGGDLRRAPVDLKSLLAHLPVEGLEVTLQAGGALQADPDLLAAALANLLDNAKRHGARQVRVSVPVPGTVCVHDDGPGAPPERLRALRDAIASAPEILFITTAGNSDSDSGFEETSPADILLPNMMTIGAVDSAGNETSFSSFGRSVVAHANGFQVESFIPGGERLRASGTSMAAPQVANLAAKLWALYPSLTVAEVRQLILDGAEKSGRVNLIHPRRTLERAAALKPGGPRVADLIAPP